MATSIGGAVAEPAYGTDGYELETVGLGALHTLASGAVVNDYIGLHYRFTLRWKAITEAEKDALRLRAEVATSQAFTAPDGEAYTVYVLPNSWKEKYVKGGDLALYYDCELQLEEIA